jgi:hypothetical protein
MRLEGRSTNELMDKIAAWQIASEAMTTNSFLPMSLMLLSMAATLGCAGVEGDDDQEALGVTQEAALTANALTANALTANALTANALTANALTANALTANALTANALTSAALTDPSARELLKYVTSCALPANKKVEFTSEGVLYSYPGQLALAPEWGLAGGSCNAECQGWVSACLLARLDYLGQKVTISLRGDKAALKPSHTELSTYTQREGTYYGNIFQVAQERLACIAPGSTELLRVCGPTVNNCVVDAIGTCNKTCDAPASDGSFPNCRDEVRFHGNFPAGTKAYPQSVTVFLKSSCH